MKLGSDVSGLSTTAATAAAQGLSIVVPLYNEAAGLARLHERLCGLARTLRQRYGLAGDFRLLSPRAAAALRQLPERNRFFKGLATWIGFRQIRVDYEPAARAHGVTSFSPGRLIGLSIEGLTSFSVAPLRFASLLGVLLAISAFLFGLTILWEVWTTGKQVPGYPSLMIGLMTIGGVQLIIIGIVREYIVKILP